MNLLYANDTRGAYPESWYAATATPLERFPTLKGAQKADVCVIGGALPAFRQHCIWQRPVAM